MMIYLSKQTIECIKQRLQVIIKSVPAVSFKLVDAFICICHCWGLTL